MAKDKIQPAEEGNYLPLAYEPDVFASIINNNLGGDELTQKDFDKAVNPSGKSVHWQIPGLTDEDELAQELTGVIIFHKMTRSYWKGEPTGDGAPPDCSSDDGKNGVGAEGSGMPGGPCEECPLSKFGSGKNNSQACRKVKQVYLLREGEMLPILINLSPINSDVAKGYFIKLMAKAQRDYFTVVTKMKLVADKSKSGFDYAKVEMSMVDMLEPASAKKMEAFHNLVSPMLGGVPAQPDIPPSEDPIQTPDF